MAKHCPPKGYSFINIFGLAVGMAACLLILLFIKDELSYDRYNQHYDRIFRVTVHLRFRRPGGRHRFGTGAAGISLPPGIP